MDALSYLFLVITVIATLITAFSVVCMIVDIPTGFAVNPIISFRPIPGSFTDTL